MKKLAMMIVLVCLVGCSNESEPKQENPTANTEQKDSGQKPIVLPIITEIKKELPMTMDSSGVILVEANAYDNKQIIFTYHGKEKFSDNLKSRFLKHHGLCEVLNDDLQKDFKLIIEYFNNDKKTGSITIKKYDCNSYFANIKSKEHAKQQMAEYELALRKKAIREELESRIEQERQETLRQQAVANANARAMAEEQRYQMQQLQRQQEQLQQQAQQQYQYYNQNNTQGYSNGNSQAMSDYCSKPVAGAKGMTAAQMQACSGSGGGYSAPVTSSPSSPVTSSPSSVGNCDSSGCWGTDGTRYNSAGGGNYYSQDGRFCQNIGGQLQCH